MPLTQPDAHHVKAEMGFIALLLRALIDGALVYVFWSSKTLHARWSCPSRRCDKSLTLRAVALMLRVERKGDEFLLVA